MNVDVSDTHIALSGILRYPNFHTHYLYNGLIKKRKVWYETECIH